MFIGGICPFLERNIKKFMAYSSVGHTGFALIILSTFEKSTEIKHAIIYVFSYFLSSLCLFIGLIGLGKCKNAKYFEELRGAIKICPTYSYTTLCGLLSMVGLPPFIGFLAKLNVFYMLAGNNRYGLIAIISIYTILTGAYTVNVIRHMFMNTEENVDDTRTKVNPLHVLSIFAILALGIGSIVFNDVENRIGKMVDSLVYDGKESTNMLLNKLLSNKGINKLYENLWPSSSYMN
jgi:NADH-quinone oxidoreductase subunit N